VDATGLLLDGFAAALTPQNLLFALIGCLLGTVLGLLPGIGSTAGMAILRTRNFFVFAVACGVRDGA
jgi:putative tricarboxylic transport membrane protein